MNSLDYILAGSALLLFLSILASRASGRLGVPALLIFLAIGMLAGSDGPGGIYFDNARLAQGLGVVALVLILFAGGLETRWERVRPVLKRGLALSTFGVFLTALLVALFVKYVLQFTWLEGLLLGSVVSSTDAAAVFAVMRSRSVSLRGELEQLLELESGSNDPMAIFLTVALIHLQVTPNASLFALIPMFFFADGCRSGSGIRNGQSDAVHHQPREAGIRRPLFGVDTVAGVAHLRRRRVGGREWLSGSVSGGDCAGQQRFHS
jgi:cell volume regulation protein A